MATNSLIETILGLAGPQIMNALSSRLGEPETAVKSGLQSAISAILGSLAGKTGNHGVMTQILELVTGSSSAGILNNLSSIAGGAATGGIGDLAQKFLGLAIGGETEQHAVAQSVAKASGLQPSSASGLLGVAAPLLIGFLGKKAASADGLNLGSLAAMLAPAASAGHAAHAAAEEDEQKSSSLLFPMFLAVAAIFGLLWWFTKGGGGHTEPVKAPTPVAEGAKTIPDTAKSLWAALGDLFKRKLPNGVEIDVPKLGVENRLIDFIEDASKPVDKTTWFDFDRLLFDTAKATLRPESEAQLKAVSEILKAFPNVEVKVGGYTDNQGDKAANQKLSSDRAASVMGELVKLGIAATRLTSEGYGEEHPVASNDNEEGRAKNRRVSLRVTKK